MASTENYIGLRDVAARYSKSLQSIRRWSLDKTLGFPPAVQLGGKIYFNLPDLEAFEARFIGRFGAKAD